MGKRRMPEWEDEVEPAKKKISSSTQKAAISQFIAVTQADKSTASKVLKQHNYNVDAAVNAFFSSSGTNNSARAPINKFFDKYRDNPRDEPDEINVEGVGKLLEDMSIGLDNIGALVVSELVASPSLGKIEREGFLSGCSQIGADSAQKLRTAVLQRTSKLPTDTDFFKQVYNHTFQLALPAGQKGVPLEMAVEFWKMMFGSEGWKWSTNDTPWLDWWIEFQEKKVKRSVNKDLWRQTFTFAQETMKDPTLSFWTEESSWPSVIDDFVEWVKTEKRGDGDAMEL